MGEHRVGRLRLIDGGSLRHTHTDVNREVDKKCATRKMFLVPLFAVGLAVAEIELPDDDRRAQEASNMTVTAGARTRA